MREVCLMHNAYQAYGVSCNILIFHDFVSRITRSRRIRHKQSALCQPTEKGAEAPF
ncbi:hypothetical protein QT341_14745 [Escherichia coli]|nr:hypothetical protein [Escherichia coli]